MLNRLISYSVIQLFSYSILQSFNPSILPSFGCKGIDEYMQLDCKTEIRPHARARQPLSSSVPLPRKMDKACFCRYRFSRFCGDVFRFLRTHSTAHNEENIPVEMGKQVHANEPFPPPFPLRAMCPGIDGPSISGGLDCIAPDFPYICYLQPQLVIRLCLISALVASVFFFFFSKA